MDSLTEHQYPGAGELFLDHVGLFVDEFKVSGEAMERLGFRLTPLQAHASALAPGLPLSPLGTGNRSAMLRVGYVEMLGPTHDTPMAAQLRAQLAHHAGWHLVAFTGQGPQAHRDVLESDGLEPLPLAKIERPHETPDGRTQVRACIVRLPPAAFPEGRVQIVFPDMSADVLWHPALVEHANAADRLSEMLLLADDPAQRARQFGRFSRRPVRLEGGRAVLETDRGRLHFITPRDAVRYLPGVDLPPAPCMVAVAIGSSSLEQTRGYLARQHLGHSGYHGTIQVTPPGLGGTFVFHDRPDDHVFDFLDQTTRHS